MARLFSEDFIRAIERLRLVARQAPPGGLHAEHRSHDLGCGMEFRDFRAYVPGDDVRRMDWNLYRRSGRLFLRLFEAPEDLPVHILLDVSDSMFFEAPPRADAARQMAAVIAAVALNQHDRVGIYPFGIDLVTPLAPASGKPALPRMLQYLEQLRPAGTTDLIHSTRRFATRRQRAGLAVIISDFFDPRGIDQVIDALRSLRHRLLLIRVVRPRDASPDLEGELRLLDCESDRSVDVSVTGDSLTRYRQAYQAFEEALSRFAARRRALHVTIDADRPVLEQLGSVFVGGVLMT
ncbi:MAG: DUF58 domain-containing protein [Phycisphaerales bacterium]|nr:MAG: DUF58 domain-containing protein [Phycisphaerales bacterium]